MSIYLPSYLIYIIQKHSLCLHPQAINNTMQPDEEHAMPISQTRIPHLLLLTYPAQGHINPALQLAKRLAAAGAFVTFATTASAIARMPSPHISNLAFASLSDSALDPSLDPALFLSGFCRLGRVSAAEILASEGRPVTCIVYTILLPWVADLARQVGIPSFLFWIQPAAIFSIYYRYFNEPTDHDWFVNLPGLPPLTEDDLPSFLRPDNPHAFMTAAFSNLFDELRNEVGKPKVLFNTFDALEKDALEAITGVVDPLTVGPLIPSAFLVGNDKSSDTTFGGDIISAAAPNHDLYLQWLDGKDEGSVVYISFGSYSVLPHGQMEEILDAIKHFQHPFMWVIRESKDQDEEARMEEFRTRVRRETEGQAEGMVVDWCSQVAVLCHPAVGCFVSHCGWNSTIEGLVAGVPIVGMPQWSDQASNGKLVEDVWRAGVRAKSGEDGVVGAEELTRCMTGAMRAEVRETAKKWRVAAREAAREGGSSERNISAFVEEIKC